MSSTSFKLIQTGPGALTRRVNLPGQPTWFTLASRIESLFGIPIQDVGVSYVDIDGDEITLSTHEELEDYYTTVPRMHGGAIKFVVKNIGAIRAQNKPQQPSPRENLFDMDDDDWQGLNIRPFPGIRIFERPEQPPPPPPKSPSSAFVETVDSSNATEAAQDIRSGTISPAIVVLGNDKGKDCEEMRPTVEDADDASSVVSVIRSDEPIKEPVHVYEFDTEEGYIRRPAGYSFRGRDSRSRSISPPLRMSRSMSPSRSRTPPPVIILSRSRSPSLPRSPRPFIIDPRPRSITPPRYAPPAHPRAGGGYPPELEIRVSSPSDPPSPVLEPVLDPPLPTTDARSPQTPSATATLPSLTNDVAGLLNALTDAFGAHPELSEGLKNIVRNASQGVYWAAERDAMVSSALRAAESAQGAAARAAEDAQEEAGRKVAEALGGVFKALGSLVTSESSPEMGQAPRSEGGPSAQEPRRSRDRSLSPIPVPPVYGHRFGRVPDSDRWGRPNSPRRVPSPPCPPPRAHSPLRRPSPPPLHHHHHRRAPPPPGPPPPGHYHHPRPPPPPGAPPFGHAYFEAYPPRLDPLMWGMPPPPPLHGLRRSSTLPSRFGGPRFGGPRFDAQPVPPPPPPPAGVPIPRISSGARKAQLEEAKQYYKSKKEEWRREKEERRKEKEKRGMQRTDKWQPRERRLGPIRQGVIYSSDEEAVQAIPPPVPPHPVELVNSSPPRGIQPERTREPFTVGGLNTASFGRDSPRERLMKRLADMDLTPRTHPQLPSLVTKQIRKQPGLSKDNEDAVIASVLEDLFVTPVPQASGSSTRPGERPSPGSNVTIPGAWNL